MEVAAGLQRRLSPAAAHALRPVERRQPRVARREQHRQKARRRFSALFPHHGAAGGGREGLFHRPARLSACAAEG